MRDPGQYALASGSSARLSDHDGGLLFNIRDVLGNKTWLWLWPGGGLGLGEERCSCRCGGSAVTGQGRGEGGGGGRAGAGGAWWSGEPFCLSVCVLYVHVCITCRTGTGMIRIICILSFWWTYNVLRTYILRVVVCSIFGRLFCSLYVQGGRNYCFL